MGAFESVRGFYQRAADRLGLEPSLSEIMARPEQELSVQIRVSMDDGTIALYQGYRVQYNGARGPYKGGIQFHPRVTLDEIRSFAALMTWKTALLGLPFAGERAGFGSTPSCSASRSSSACPGGSWTRWACWSAPPATSWRPT